MKIGVVSDTHGLLRPEVAPALRGVERILHLGDVGDSFILKALEKIAPVHAVRGNVDRIGACSRLPETDVLLIEGHYIYMLHNIDTLRLDPAAAKLAVVTRTSRRSGGPREFCTSIPAPAALGDFICRSRWVC